MLTIGTEELVRPEPVDSEDEGQPEAKPEPVAPNQRTGNGATKVPEKSVEKKRKKTAKPTAKKKGRKAAEKKTQKANGTNALRTTTPPKGALQVGTEFTYPGGSRCAWLKKGQEGVITRYHVNRGGTFRYGCAFEVNGRTRTTQLAIPFVEKRRK